MAIHIFGSFYSIIVVCDGQCRRAGWSMLIVADNIQLVNNNKIHLIANERQLITSTMLDFKQLASVEPSAYHNLYPLIFIFIFKI